jgi:hypothetical protein
LQFDVQRMVPAYGGRATQRSAVIVITGVGRSGTSYLASVYRELGFDPGGRWQPDINAGLESDDVVAVNERLARDLGLRFFGAPPRSAVRRWLPHRPRSFHGVDPADVEALAAEHGEELRALSARAVVKDPRFCWTLAVWAAAGACIEHVVISVRAMDAVVDSRVAAGHLRFGARRVVVNELIHGLGLCVAAVTDHRLPHAIVRFPDYLDDPAALHAQLPFPEPVDRDRFVAAARTISRRELVHDWR